MARVTTYHRLTAPPELPASQRALTMRREEIRAATRRHWVRRPRARDAPAAPLRGGTDGPDAATISAWRAWRTEAICSPPVGDEQSCCRMRGTPWPTVSEAILRNHGWGRACVGLRPKDLALIGLKPRGSPPSVVAPFYSLARCNGVPWHSMRMRCYPAPLSASVMCAP